MSERPDTDKFRGFIDELDYSDQAAVDQALQEAVALARAPVSGFSVGALAEGASGRGYLGANLEFSGVPLNSSLHAEQSAVINAWVHGESRIVALYLTQQPCGHCLQFLQELDRAEDLKLVVDDRSYSLRDLLPQPFHLPGRTDHRLLNCPIQNLVDIRPTEDALAQRAINAACHSYTPYTHSPEGFVIESITGHCFAGRSAESAAFNPSVPAVVAALNQRNLSAQRNDAISRCIHAKLATSVNHSLALSEAIMQSISGARVECRLMESAL